MFGSRRRRVGGGSGGSRERLDFGELRRLLGLALTYRPYLLFGIAAVAVSGLLTLALPLLARELFNRAFAAQPLAGESVQLDGIIFVLLAIFVVQAIFNFLRVYLLGIVGEGVVADLRRKLFSHLLELPVAFFDSRKTGEITSRLTADVATVQAAVSQGFAMLVNQSVTLLGAAIVLLVLNWQLTLVMLAVVPTVIIAGTLFGRRLRRVSERFQDEVASANANAEEALSGIRVVKAFNAEPLERARYSAAILKSFDLGRARVFARALFVPTLILAMFSGIALVLWYGGRQVLAGALAPGDLVAFLVLMLFLAGSVGTITGLYAQVQEAIGASRRIFDLLNERPEFTTAVRGVSSQGHEPLPQPVPGEVVLEGVTFGYGDRGHEPVLRGIDLQAVAGSVLALVGPSGAGKSTLVSLLPRFYDPQDGRILLDGVDIRRFDPDDLRSLIAMVPQETQLFSGSIADNIRYGRPEANDAEVLEAARAANAERFVREFPDGFDTQVGERGVKLSGGQRQRIAIARALLKNPRILILDEATSSLDSESEALVQEALSRLMEGRTSFVIAHRLATVLSADSIAVLDGGRIVQQGSHSALLAQGGLYGELFSRQFDVDALARA